MNISASNQHISQEDKQQIGALRWPILEELACAVRHELGRNGCFVLRTPSISSQEFRSIGEMLGSIISDGKVTILPSPVSLATSTHALPLHTDEPLARYIAWYCERQQTEQAVATNLLDISDFRSSLGEPNIRILSTIVIPGAGRQYKDEKAVIFVDEEPRLNFIPWAHHILDSPDKVRAFDALHQYVKARAAELENISSVILSEGEMLFIDNNRFLHGRDPLDAKSIRCLRRLWIEG